MLKTIKSFITEMFPVSSRNSYHFLNRFLYTGEKYYCPICEKGYKKFLPGGDNLTGNSKCPGCSSLERQRLLWLYLNQKINIQNKKIKLLNVAPDLAIQSKLRSLNNIDYISIDLESKLAMQKQDLTNLTFNENYFDAIICYHVLEHIYDDRKAMSELLRVLKPGGWAIIQTPIESDREKTYEDFSITSPKERKKIFGQEDHVRIYGRDYFNRLEQVGFRVIKDDFINKFDESEIERLVLDKGEILFFCTKPVK
jgi:SAM-dependent methyltransferase